MTGSISDSNCFISSISISAILELNDRRGVGIRRDLLTVVARIDNKRTDRLSAEEHIAGEETEERVGWRKTSIEFGLR